jgi:hypothetical protein
VNPIVADVLFVTDDGTPVNEPGVDGAVVSGAVHERTTLPSAPAAAPPDPLADRESGKSSPEVPLAPLPAITSLVV